MLIPLDAESIRLYLIFTMKRPIEYCWSCGTKATTRFVEGRDRKICPDCGTILYENPFPTTAALCFNGKGNLLLVRRSVRPAKDHWCLPGGFLELGETPEEGVLRELKEETNLDGEVLSLVGLSPSLNGFWGDVVVIGYHVQLNGGDPVPGDDAREVRFWSMESRPPLAFQTHESILERFLDRL